MDILMNYESLWRSIIRPTRQEYCIADMGPATLITKSNEKVRRVDFEIANKANLQLKCSFFEFPDRFEAQTPPPCVVYLHCNSGSRLEGLPLVVNLLNNGMSVCLFDFAGSGMSEGAYISLGYNEVHDLQAVLKHVKERFNVTKFALWGRSMGAVTGLRLVSNETSNGSCGVVCGVFDSPFSNFRHLAIELGVAKTGLPEFMVKGALNFITSSINDRAGFNIEELDILASIGNSTTPALFIASKQDSLVKCHHSERLSNAYSSETSCSLVYFDAGHNEQRPANVIKQCIDFILENFIKEGVSFKDDTAMQQQSLSARPLHLTSSSNVFYFPSAISQRIVEKKKQSCDNSTSVAGNTRASHIVTTNDIININSLRKSVDGPFSKTAKEQREFRTAVTNIPAIPGGGGGGTLQSMLISPAAGASTPASHTSRGERKEQDLQMQISNCSQSFSHQLQGKQIIPVTSPANIQSSKASSVVASLSSAYAHARATDHVSPDNLLIPAIPVNSIHLRQASIKLFERLTQQTIAVEQINQTSRSEPKQLAQTTFSQSISSTLPTTPKGVSQHPFFLGEFSRPTQPLPARKSEKSNKKPAGHQPVLSFGSIEDFSVDSYSQILPQQKSALSDTQLSSLFTSRDPKAYGSFISNSSFFMPQSTTATAATTAALSEHKDVILPSHEQYMVNIQSKSQLRTPLLNREASFISSSRTPKAQSQAFSTFVDYVPQAPSVNTATGDNNQHRQIKQVPSFSVFSEDNDVKTQLSLTAPLQAQNYSVIARTVDSVISKRNRLMNTSSRNCNNREEQLTSTSTQKYSLLAGSQAQAIQNILASRAPLSNTPKHYQQQPNTDRSYTHNQTLQLTPKSISQQYQQAPHNTSSNQSFKIFNIRAEQNEQLPLKEINQKLQLQQPQQIVQDKPYVAGDEDRSAQGFNYQITRTTQQKFENTNLGTITYRQPGKFAFKNRRNSNITNENNGKQIPHILNVNQNENVPPAVLDQSISQLSLQYLRENNNKVPHASRDTITKIQQYSQIRPRNYEPLTEQTSINSNIIQAKRILDLNNISDLDKHKIRSSISPTFIYHEAAKTLPSRNRPDNSVNHNKNYEIIQPRSQLIKIDNITQKNYATGMR